MNNVEIIKGIEMVVEGLETIKKFLATTNSAVEVPKKSVEKKDVEKTPVEEPEVKGAETGKFDVEQLNSMKYNEFKKLASSLGVKCTGTRDEIMERILALDVTITEDDAEVSNPAEEEEEETPVKSGKSSGVKKFGKKKADDEEPAKDEFDEQAEEIAKETPVEDIIASLNDVDIKATKKNAVTLLAKALREGLIELEEDDEEEDSSVVETETEETDGEEIESTSYFPELDPNGYNNPEEMTEERAEAIEAKMDEILTAYSEGDLTDEDIASYVEDNATDEEIELLGEEYDELDILKLYMELVKRTIDNDGEEHEQGEPYELADKDVCCGHELKYSKKTKKYICEKCGTEYKAE